MNCHECGVDDGGSDEERSIRTYNDNDNDTMMSIFGAGVSMA